MPTSSNAQRQRTSRTNPCTIGGTHSNAVICGLPGMSLSLPLIARRSGCFGLLVHRRHRGFDIHPHRLEDMAVEILEGAAVHEAIILRIARLATARGQRRL